MAQAHAAKRDLHEDKAPAQAISTAVEAAWRMAILGAFPHNTVAAWGAREKSQAKWAADNWLHRNQITFPDFAAWAATHWTAIMRKQFNWMTKSPPPTVPAWGFFIAQLHHFAECWGEQRLEDWLSDADRTEIEKLMARGHTWEEAVASLSEVKAKGVLRGEMIRVKQDAEITRRAAELTLHRAQKLADHAGNAPIHPRSRAAMQMRREAEGVRKPTVIEPSPGDFKGFTAGTPLPDKYPFDGDE